MPVDAAQIQYRDEYITGFEKKQSLARRTCTTEMVMKGNQAVFLVADSGGATAVTRGANGDIPVRSDSNTQNTCTLAEWHDVVEKTNFNILSSQGNQRQLMQATFTLPWPPAPLPGAAQRQLPRPLSTSR